MTTSARFIRMNAMGGAWLAGRAVALAAVLVAAAGCAGSGDGAAPPAAGPAPAEKATDPLQVEQGHLAWGELRLGMTVQEAEQRLGHGFGFTRTEGACPGVTAPVRLHGHAVHVMFDSKEPEGTLRGATVELTDGDLDALVAAVRSRIPGLESIPGPDEPGTGEGSPTALLALTADPEQAVLAKPAEALTITYADCLN